MMYLQAKPLTLKDSKSAPLFDLDEEMEMGIDDSDDKSKGKETRSPVNLQWQ